MRFSFVRRIYTLAQRKHRPHPEEAIVASATIAVSKDGQELDVSPSFETLVFAEAKTSSSG
jgi:hypothetical protein